MWFGCQEDCGQDLKKQLLATLESEYLIDHFHFYWDHLAHIKFLLVSVLGEGL
jgi:hypothetical protein